MTTYLKFPNFPPIRGVGPAIVGITCRNYIPIGFTCKEAGFSPENYCEECKSNGNDRTESPSD